MKVLFVCLFTKISSLSDYFYSIVKRSSELLSIQNVGVITSASLKDKMNFLNADNLQFINFQKYQLSSWIDKERFKAVMLLKKRFNPDYIFFYSENPYHVILSYLFNDINQALLILDPIPHSQPNLAINLIYEIAKRILIRRSHVIFVACKEVQNQYRLKYSHINDNVQIMMHGNMETISFVYESNKERYKSLPLKYDFLFFGRINYYKGIDILLDSLMEVLNKFPNATLCIIGTPGDKKVLKQIYGFMNKTKNLTFINGYLPDSRLIEFIRNSRCIVMPYRDATGSHTVQISNYLGRPVLASRVGCFREYIKDGINGITVRPGVVNDLVNAMAGMLSGLYEFNEDSLYDFAKNEFSNKKIISALLDYLQREM